MIEIRREYQAEKITDEVQALIAVVLPILKGLLYAQKNEAIDDAGGYENIKLRQLPRIYREGSGDVGICFEYAVHDAILTEFQPVISRIDHALSKFCKIKHGDVKSLLFGAEKSGSIQLIKSIKDNLTNESRLLSGSKGQPVRLKKHIDAVAAAFRYRTLRAALPNSINGLWKADLFLGRTLPDQWVGTTVKINANELEHASGLRLGIVPTKQGKSDKVYLHETKNLVICPLPYDESFMEIFYSGWQIVKQFLTADAKVPREVFLPRPADRQVCRFLEQRRDFPVLEVIEALRPLAQKELIHTQPENVDVHVENGIITSTETIVAPFSHITDI
ncbi:hypothetical protein [Paenibacillus physcomitrellae]|uniref:Uncharacterized protein n=1 Tax=Paenibacillus physcomitrellae TaxID=1619311 RepID=A0ABQ1GMU7_9BACL|nr:hypothetical protein [Paenibacillus physcomitrellae]GGA46762.1 hypothetical protein GCM10010917_35030 [Paenibacillus physcomitrellae]